MTSLATTILSVSHILGTLTNQLGANKNCSQEVQVSVLLLARGVSEIASAIGPWQAYTVVMAETVGTIASATVTGKFAQIGNMVALNIGFNLIDPGVGSTGDLTFTLPVAAKTETLQMMLGWNAGKMGIALINTTNASSCTLVDYQGNSMATTTVSGAGISGIYEAA